MNNDKRHHPIMATNWETYLMEAIKTGLESPTPYKVIPYKNGIGIKKIEFLPLVIDVGKTYSEHGESEYELI
tara:strand:+ start:211 stop:426 length:216 start_codon:yes stop_codon:yes gene_type:complete